MKKNRYIKKSLLKGGLLLLSGTLLLPTCKPPEDDFANRVAHSSPISFDTDDIHSQHTDIDSLLKAYDLKMQYARQSQNNEEIARTLHKYFDYYMYRGMLQDAYNYADSLDKLGSKTENIYIQARGYLDLCRILARMNNYSIASKNFAEAMGIFSRLHDTANIARTLLVMGQASYNVKNYDSASSYLNGATGLAKKMNLNVEFARAFAYNGEMELQIFTSNLANPNPAHLHKSKQLLEASKSLNQECYNAVTDQIINLALTETNYFISLGINEPTSRLGYQNNVLANINDALEYAKFTNQTDRIQLLYEIWVNTLIAQKRLAEAKEIEEKIARICQQDSSYTNQQMLFSIKSSIAEAEGRYHDAMVFSKKANLFKNSENEYDQSYATSLMVAKNQNQGEKMRAMMEIRGQQQAKRTLMMISLIVLLSITIITILIYRNLRRSKILNDKITAQNDEIKTINNEVTKQNKEITDGINYASLIQTAILPSEEKMQSIFGDHLVIYKAKEIVSGDYFWAYETARQKLIAVCDCTGHGVPGAMLSMLGINILEHATRRISFQPKTASEILDDARTEFKKILNQTHYTAKGAKDSIDIAIIVYNKPTKTLDYAGAFRPLYIIRNGELIKYKADPMPIGVYPIEKDHFTNHMVKLEENDFLYMFSDGIQDQFGWTKGRVSPGTFSTKRFNEMLLNNYQKPFSEQKEIFLKEIEEWKKGKDGNQTDCNQTDDNVVIGISVKNMMASNNRSK